MELKENLFQLTDFHMKVIFAIAEGDAELTEAMNLLEQAMCVVVRDADFILADHHLRRVHTCFWKGSHRVGFAPALLDRVCITKR